MRVCHIRYGGSYMESSIDAYLVQQVWEHDGYAGEVIWKKKKNSSMYFDHDIDKQFKVPVTSPAELQKKYGLNSDKSSD